MFVRRSLLAAFCLVLAATSLSAQSPAVHALEGAVRDSTGGVIVGATVTLTRPGSADETRLSDDTGRFRFENLPVGEYRVAVAAPGFAEFSRAIEIGGRPVATIDVVLQVRITEHVEVATSIGGTASAGLTATTLTGAALEALPDDPDGLLQRLRELAGATGDPARIAVMVDGFRQTVRLPPKQAIQAIRISSNWFAPEFAEPGQARVDIITRPGSSAVHGEVKLNFNDESMNARNALAPDRPSGQMRDVSGYVSGPIVPGRWSFVAYGGHWLQRRNQVLHATVVDPRSFEPAPYAANVTAPSRIGNLWLGTTYQIAAPHTLAVSLSRTSESARNLGLDGGLDLQERAYRRTGDDDALRATLTSVPSSRVLNEFRAQLHPQRSLTQAESVAAAVMVLDAFSAGGNQGALFTSARHREIEAFDAITVFARAHTIKAGFEGHSSRRRYTDRTYSGGLFVFGSDFERDAAGTPVVDQNGARVPVSPLESYRRTLLGLPGYAPSQFSITRGDPDVRFDERWIGAFLQDDWVVRPRVTLSYGVRSEWQSAASAPGLGARAGVAFALDSGRRHVIRAGAGTFYQRIEPELTLDTRRLDGTHQEQLLIDRPGFFPVVPADMPSAAALQPTIYVAARHLPPPRSFISAVSYDKQLPGNAFLTFKYSFQRGTDLLRTRNINAPDERGARPLANFGPVLQYEATGGLRRHEIASGWRSNLGSRGSLFANYSYVHARSDTDGRGTLPADSRRLDAEWGPSAADRPHQVIAGASVNVPGGVSISPYFVVTSGRTFNITTGFDNNRDGLFADRPAAAANGDPSAIATAFGSFDADPAAADAIVPRNLGREPAAMRVDLRLSRSIRPYRGGSTLILSATLENLLNRASFEGFNGVVTSPAFGQPNRAQPPRRISLSGSVSF